MSKPILEKAIVHLLNGDQDKAEALFHKFMVERARSVHESLRQDEEIDLGEGWDKEIAEEEYFGDDDLDSAEDDAGEGSMSPLGHNDGPEMGGDEMGDEMGDEAPVDGEEMGDDMEGLDADMDADADAEMGGEDDVGDKIDNLESKIDELTAEFDRLMSELEDHEGGDAGELGDDEFGSEDSGDEFSGDDVEDVEGEEPHMDSEDSSDLADRMDDDMADDDGVQPEDETMEGMDMGDENEIDEELADITESVLSELEKVAMPGNTPKEVGSGGKAVPGNTRTPFEPHPVNDRISQAKPYMVKGGNNDSFEREASPPVKPVTDLVTGAKNSRKKWSDGMEKKSKEGDSSALINSNFAGGEKTSNSPVDGNARMRPKTR